MADVAKGSDGRPGQCFRWRGPLANRPLPPGNHQNNAEKRHEVRDEMPWRRRQAAMTMPASAGPTARARLNSIPLSADAAARSSLGTNSGRIARHVGVSNASPAESANVNTSSSQGDMKPAMVKTARSRAMPIIHDSVKRISLRRSKISPAEPAGRASRKMARKRQSASAQRKSARRRVRPSTMRRRRSA